MKIDIRNIPVFYINLDREEKRSRVLEKNLKRVGFKDIRRFAGSIKETITLGCADSHQRLFEHILETGIEGPFLILEDDVSFTEEAIYELEIPDNSDAVYLGLSTSARNGSYTTAKIVADKVNDDYYRLYNMLAAHAVLHINIEYAKFLHKAIDIAIAHGAHQDIVRANTMRYFNIYAKNDPVFFQNDIKNLRVKQTYFKLDSRLPEAANISNLGYACSCHRHD